MAFVWMLVVGLMVGALAKLLVDGKSSLGAAMALTLGVAGSIVAGLIGRGMGLYDRPGEGAGIVASLFGAGVLLLVYRSVRNRGAE